MSHFQSLLRAHIAVFFMGITGLLAAMSGFAAWHVTSYRVCLGGIFLLGVLAFKPGVAPSPRQGMKLVAMGFVLSLHWFTFFYSLELLGLMLGYAMTGIQPLLIALFGTLFLKERLSRPTKLSLAIAVLGFVCLGLGASHSPHLWRGIGVSILSFCLFSWLILFNRKQVQETSSLWVTALEMVGAIPLTLIWTFQDWNPASLVGWGYALFLGLVCTGFAYWLYNGSMRQLPAPTAGLVLSLEVVYGMVGGFFLGDSLEPLQLLGGLLIANILAFDVWAYWRYRTKKSSEK